MPELELLRRLAPPDPEPPTAEAEAAARALLLDRIARAERPAPRRRRRRVLVPALALVAAAAIAAVVVAARGPAVSDAAAAVLRRAAATARGAVPTRPLRDGQFLYTLSEDAYQSTTVLGEKGRSFTVLVPHRRESWIGPDNKGWLISHIGTPRFVTPQQRRNWIALGRPDLGEHDMNLALENSDGSTPPMGSLALPADPAALDAYLRRQAEGNSHGTEVEMFTLIADGLRESFTTPAQRAALYEVAARLPGVRLVGTRRDGAGRSGTAVAIDDGESRETHLLIFDPATSALLAEEYTALPGHYSGVAAGTKVGWSTYLRAEVVDRIKERPAP
jgi:hypothetical protein